MIGGATAAVERADRRGAGGRVHGRAPAGEPRVPHRIVAPASEPLRQVLERLRLQAPALPDRRQRERRVLPVGPGRERAMLDILARQVASPVQFVKGLETLYAAGARVFVEVGPKRALQGFVDDVLGDRPTSLSLFTNHPKVARSWSPSTRRCAGSTPPGSGWAAPAERAAPPATSTTAARRAPGRRLAAGGHASGSRRSGRRRRRSRARARTARRRVPRAGGGAPARRRTGVPSQAPVVVTGAALGLPGTERIFDDDNVGRLLHGEQLIDVIPTRFRHAILDKHITRLVKSDERRRASRRSSARAT